MLKLRLSFILACLVYLSTVMFAGPPLADVNRDMKVSFNDIYLISKMWGYHAPVVHYDFSSRQENTNMTAINKGTMEPSYNGIGSGNLSFDKKVSNSFGYATELLSVMNNNCGIDTQYTYPCDPNNPFTAGVFYRNPDINESNSQLKVIFGAGNSSPPNPRGWVLLLDQNGLEFYLLLKIYNSQGSTIVFQSPAFQRASQLMIILSYNGDSSGSIYIGNLITKRLEVSQEILNMNFQAYEGNFNLGNFSNTNDMALGEYDDFAIWDRPISAIEAAYLFESEMTNPLTDINRDSIVNLEDFAEIAKYWKYSGRVFYVSNSMGNDNNDGFSPNSPWKTLSKVASSIFFGADTILLRRSDVWNESLTFTARGSKFNPITISAYGSGLRPVIQPSVNDSICLKITGGGIIVSSLEFTKARVGIQIEHDNNFNNSFFRIEDCAFRDLDDTYNSQPLLYNHFSTGLFIAYRKPWTGSNIYEDTITDLVVKNCDFINCNYGIHTGEIFQYCNPQTGFMTGDFCRINKSRFENLNAVNCSQTGFSFISFRNTAIINCDTNHCGYGDNQYGTTGGLVAYSENILFDECNFVDTSRGVRNYDGCGFDFEGHTDNVTLANSNIVESDGTGLFIFDNSGSGSNTNLVVKNVAITSFGRNPGNTKAGVHVAGVTHTGTLTGIRLNDTYNQPYREGAYLTGLTWNYLEQSTLISLGKAAYATDYAIGYEPSKAVDGDINTAWVASDGTMPQAIWIDLGLISNRYYAITGIQVDFYVESTYNFIVYGSGDGNLWLEITNIENWQGKKFYYNGGDMYRFIKLKILDAAGHWAQAAEISIWGY